MYGELVPPTIAELVSYLELQGPHVDHLFGGDPAVRDINDLLDDVRAGADLHVLSRGDVHLAAAALAAYCRQLPDSLVPAPEAKQLCAALDGTDFAYRVAGVRDLIATLPESNQAVLHRICHFLHKLGSTAHDASGNDMAQLALFWSSMLMPASSRRDQRVKDFRLVSLLLQHCACVFEGALEAVELP